MINIKNSWFCDNFLVSEQDRIKATLYDNSTRIGVLLNINKKYKILQMTVENTNYTDISLRFYNINLNLEQVKSIQKFNK